MSANSRVIGAGLTVVAVAFAATTFMSQNASALDFGSFSGMHNPAMSGDRPGLHIGQSGSLDRDSERHGEHEHGHDGMGRGIGLGTGLMLNVISRAVEESGQTVERGHGQVIGDGPGTKSVAVKAATCKWILAGVTITNYGGSNPDDNAKGKWKAKLKSAAVDLAKKIVEKFGSKGQNGVMDAIVADTTVSEMMDVYLSYACVSDGTVMATSVVGPLEDKDSSNWWKDGKLNENNQAEKQSSVAQHQPTWKPTL